MTAAADQKTLGDHVMTAQLIISSETGLTLKVDPDQRYESWQISSDDGPLIVCTPGGDLNYLVSS